MDLHRLTLLRELNYRGTIAAVAQALSYSPSTISAQLSQLETEIGVPLLEPVGRRLRLTPQAQILVRHTEAILLQVETAEAEIAHSMHELSGTVRIALFQTAALALLPSVLSALALAHPMLRIEFAQAETEQALPQLLHDFDLVVGEEYPGHLLPRPTNVSMVELIRDPIRLAGAGDHDGEAADLSEFADRVWVMEPVGAASRAWAVERCRASGFEPDVPYETDDVVVHRRLAEAGLALALLPDLLFVGTAPSLPLVRIGEPDFYSRSLFMASRSGSSAHPAILTCQAAFAAAAN